MEKIIILRERASLGVALFRKGDNLVQIPIQGNRNGLPSGVRQEGTRFVARVHIGTRWFNLGTYDTVEDAALKVARFRAEMRHTVRTRQEWEQRTRELEG